MKSLVKLTLALVILFSCMKEQSNRGNEETGEIEQPSEEIPLPLNILCRGNSLTFGAFASSPDSSYPSRMQQFYGSKAVVRNQGIPGDQTYFGLLATFNDSISGHYLSNYKNVVIAWEITNELTATLLGKHPCQIAIDSGYERIKRFCLLSKQKGFSVIAGTCIARLGGGQPAGFDSCRQVINARIKANFPNLGIDVSPLDEAPQLSNAANLTYYNVDQVHLTDLGYKVVYELLLQKIRSIK
jgi:hypothetical protein